MVADKLKQTVEVPKWVFSVLMLIAIPFTTFIMRASSEWGKMNEKLSRVEERTTNLEKTKVEKAQFEDFKTQMNTQFNDVKGYLIRIDSKMDDHMKTHK